MVRKRFNKLHAQLFYPYNGTCLKCFMSDSSPNKRDGLSSDQTATRQRFTLGGGLNRKRTSKEARKSTINYSTVWENRHANVR